MSKTIEEIAAWLAENEISENQLEQAIDYNNSKNKELEDAREYIIDSFFDYLAVLCPDIEWSEKEISELMNPLLDKLEAEVKAFDHLTKSQAKRVSEQLKGDKAYTKFFKDIGLI